TMQTRRSSVLGKRAHESTTDHHPPPTPDPSPITKRARTSLEGDWNKENIAPFANAADSSLPSSPSPPPLRRTSTAEYTTPTRTPPKRHASTSNIFIPPTPTTEIAHLSLSTPPPTPIHTTQPTHARARALLRATCNSSSAQIAGREVEREAVKAFAESFLHDDDSNTPTTLYISGSPGTGKTALVNSVLRPYSNDSNLRIISINCMALNNLDELWDRIVEELVPDGGGRRAMVSFSLILYYHTSNLTNLPTHSILVLDELDHIAPTSTPLISIFSLPNTTPSTLRIIGIANTHTLSSSLSHTHSNKTIKTLHFAPYDPNQLLDILRARLRPLFEGDGDDEGKKFLPLPTLTLLTKKVASQTGDVRSLFEVLRGAIDLASSSTSNNTSTVTPAHILAALKAHAPSSTPTCSSTSSTTTNTGTSGGTSETVTKIRNLGLQPQLVLLSILLASKRLEAGLSLSPSSPTPSKSKSPIKRTLSSSSSTTTSPGIETTALHAYYTTLLTRAANEVFTPVSRSEFSDVVGTLEVVGLVFAPLSSSLSSSSSSSISRSGGTSPVKGGGGKRTFGRSASFGGAGARGCVSGVVKIAEGVRVDEVLRGLGVGDRDLETKNVREEEMCVIWEKERARIGRDGRVL
ncbi:hypothetical protein PILCRDRAFT_38396, partial [Piloderma croceum F 1598]